MNIPHILPAATWSSGQKRLWKLVHPGPQPSGNVREPHLPGKCVGVGDSPANWRLVRPRFEIESPVRPDP
jgi:hypothetical protein